MFFDQDASIISIPGTIISIPGTTKQALVTSFTRQLLQQQGAQLPRWGIRSLLPGDCIVAVNGRPVSDLGDMAAACSVFRTCGRYLSLLVWRSSSVLRQAVSATQLAVGSQTASIAAEAAAEAIRAVLYAQLPYPPQQHGPTLSQVAATTASTTGKHGIATFPSIAWRTHYSAPKNMLFRDVDTGRLGLEYADDEFADPDEGKRSALFLPRIEAAQFRDWLRQRKAAWRKSYEVHTLTTDEERIQEEICVRSSQDEEGGRMSSSVPVNFWSPRGYADLQHWLVDSTAKWKQRYSWNKRKRQRLEEDCHSMITLDDPFADWLRVRKNQWKVQRRKRQRLEGSVHSNIESTPMSIDSSEASFASPQLTKKRKSPPVTSPTSVVQLQQVSFPDYTRTQQKPELVLIDALLEEEERERKALETRPPVDISFLFEEGLGCPDDVVVHCFQYLDPLEHGKLLSINKKTRTALMKRNKVWRKLMPAHWKLPRRPRKPWYELYRTQLRDEKERSRKRWDDLLSKAAGILLKGDQLQKIEKLVSEAERDFNYDVNYTSGVVCERNSLLNLAVIHQRHSK
jgi:hypothetical protein